MKANELRIGNLVNKITTRDNDADLTIVNAEDIFNVSADIDFYEPILLTEYWLYTFGFKKTEHKYYYFISLFECYFNKELDVLINGYKSSLFISIKYVHQLQNLYFALTGEELECQPSYF